MKPAFTVGIDIGTNGWQIWHCLTVAVFASVRRFTKRNHERRVIRVEDGQ